MIIKDIAIVGGGTAGLITALMLRKTYPNLKIDLVESDKIGIVGVGEGSTEHWKDFMADCDISLSELVKETDATFKYGINFDNWNGDGKNYIHSVSSAYNIESQTHSKIVYAYLIANGAGPKDIVHEYIEKSLHRQPYWGVNQFHFNTFKLNQYLHNLCEQRNITVIKAEVSQVTLTEDGSIDKLITEDGRELAYDFYMDSTGFHRLLLQKTMGIAWKSYQKYLPMNSAIAFPTERQEDIPSWTLSKALSSGWLWRIPTRERFGNGYVFNDQYLTFDQAQQEVEQLYGHSIDIGKKIKFDAGRLEKFWHKNCAAIGLSSSFIEPLEASSIGSSIQQARIFSTLLSSYVPNTEYAERIFNNESVELIENILDFVALHYMVKRNDTDFWKSTKDLEQPDGLKEKLEIFKHKFPGKSDFPNKRVMFKEANWIVVMHGLGLISPAIAQTELDMQPAHIQNSIKYNVNFSSPQDEFISHRQALNWLIENPEQR